MEPRVSAIAVRVALDVAALAGVGVPALLRRVRLEDTFQDPTQRVPWDTLADVLEALADALGGYAELRRASERFVDTVPAFAAVARQFMTPAAVMEFVILVVDPAAYPMIEHGLEVLGPRRFRVRGRLLPGFRSCRAYFEASAGAMRGMPRYLGLGMGEVTAEVTDREGVYELQFPGAPDTEAAPAPAHTVDHPALGLIDQMGLAFVQQLSAQHQLTASLKETARALESVVEQTMAAVPNAAFVYSLEGGIHSANETGRILRERDAAGLEAALRRSFVEPDEGAPYSVLPLLQGRALLIARGGQSRVEARLTRATARWRLTPRQSEVLALLVQGHSNKDIAQALGCATKTVEIHLSALLEKAGVESRLALLSLFWSL